MKNILLATLLLVMNFDLVSQTSKFTFGIDYSLNFSKTTDPEDARFRDYNDMKVGHNVFVKSEYRLSGRFNITGGIGYLSSSHYEHYHLGGQLEIHTIEYHRYHNYIVVPIGIKYFIRSFFVNPEVGLGVNTSNRNTTTITNTNGLVEVIRHSDKANVTNIHAFSIPVFFSFGKEFYSKEVVFIFGITGYYSLTELDFNNDGTNHNTGFGILIGARF